MRNRPADKGRSLLNEAEASAEFFERKYKRDREKHPDWNWNGSTGPWQHESREKFIELEMKRIKRNRDMKRKWPKGKQKMQVVLEHIRKHRSGLAIGDIRTFVYNMNGKKGPAPHYYWMSILQNPDDISHGKHKIGLLKGWCDQDPVTKKWVFRKGQELIPPFLKPDTSRQTTAGEYRRRLGRDPRHDGIRIHRQGPDGLSCTCPIPDDFVIDKHRVKREHWDALGFKVQPNDQYYGYN